LITMMRKRLTLPRSPEAAPTSTTDFIPKFSR
jgi:hypothetical protein